MFLTMFSFFLITSFQQFSHYKIDKNPESLSYGNVKFGEGRFLGDWVIG
jgi:hypothetical protein